MAPHLLFHPLNDLNGLNHSSSHTSHENQLLLSSEAESGDNFPSLTGQHPRVLTGQHPHKGQLEQGQLMTPQIPFQPRSIQNTHQVQRWLEEADVFQGFRDGHDHESHARFEDSETQFGCEEARLFRPFAQTEDCRDEQLVESQGLRRPQEMLTQPEEQMEQGGLGQTRDGTIPSLATGFVHQPFQDLQNHHSPYDAHNPSAASSQAYFQQQPDQHGRQWTYQDTQHGDQDRHQNEVQPYTVSPWDLLPQQTANGQPNHQRQQSIHTSQPQEAAYAQQPIWPSASPDTQSWAATLVPSSPSGRDLNSPPLREDSPEQVSNGRQYHQGQQSMYSCELEQVAYGQQPIRDSKPPRILSRAATLIPSNPPGVDSDSMTHRQLRVRNNSLSVPSHLGRDDLIKQAKTAKPIQRVNKSKRSQKRPKPKGLTAGCAVETPPKTRLSAAKKHCPTCTCTQAVVSPKNLYCSSFCHTGA